MASSPSSSDNGVDDNDPDALWNHIEANYFSSMRENREKEDRELVAGYSAKREALESDVVAKYNDLVNLQRQMQALKDQIDESQAKIKALDGEMTVEQEARARHRQAEDEKRRLWFKTYRRNGLAYRMADVEMEGLSDGPNVNGQQPKEGEPVVVRKMTVTVEDVDDDEMEGVEVTGRAEVPQHTAPQHTEAQRAEPQHMKLQRTEPEHMEAPQQTEPPQHTEQPTTPQVPEDVEMSVPVGESETTSAGVEAAQGPVTAAAEEELIAAAEVRGQGEEKLVATVEVEGHGEDSVMTPEVQGNGEAPVTAAEGQNYGEATVMTEVQDHGEAPVTIDAHGNGEATATTETQGYGEIAASPSSSSELSSRHTTPVLDSPVSMPNGASPPAFPDSPSTTRKDSFTKPTTSGGGFTPVNGAATPAEPSEEDTAVPVAAKKPRKSLPGGRKTLPSTPMRGTPDVSSVGKPPRLPEITKAALCLRDDGAVFTEPPIMRGVPLAKISPQHPYWEADWVPVEKVVEPLLRKHQEKYEQLEAEGSKHRDKHLANRDAKRGRTILRFLEEGDIHPYQLVGKEWFNSKKITNYDTLFRLAQLLLMELPGFNLDVTPTEWLRHRIHEVFQEKGPNFNVARWIEKAYHDPKVEEAREKNGLPSVGRPPAHRMSKGGDGSTTKPPPRQLKRKDPHSTPVSTPQQSFTAAAAASAAAAATPAADAEEIAAEPQPASKSKIIKLKIPTNKKPRITLTTPADDQGKGNLNANANGAGPSSTSTSSPSKPPTSPSALTYDGYTSTDSISDDMLMHIDFRVHQVKTSTIASNTRVTQYWHWLGGPEGLFEHQVLRSVRPPKWSVFKDPYDFHLRRAEVREVVFAKENKRVVIKHVKDGRGDIMAQFKRERTKRRFLMFMKGEGVKVVQVSNDAMDGMWESMNPETLPAGDSD